MTYQALGAADPSGRNKPRLPMMSDEDRDRDA